jgi:hypothetical protein
MDAYATHQHALIEAALATTGDILELGSGDYSTPLLSAIAKHRGNRLVIKSSDPVWADRFRDIAEVEIVDWATWEPEGKYGLVFLDNEQLTSDRIKWIPKLAKIAKVIVMHDADAAMCSPEYESMTDGLDCVIHAKHTPWTAVFKC